MPTNWPAAGFAEPDTAAQRIGTRRAGTYAALRSAAARDALEAVLPVLVEALGRAPEPMRALTRLDGVLERMPSAINVFRLLEARPALATLLVAILSHAPPLAEALTGASDDTCIAFIASLASWKDGKLSFFVRDVTQIDAARNACCR